MVWYSVMHELTQGKTSLVLSSTSLVGFWELLQRANVNHKEASQVRDPSNPLATTSWPRFPSTIFTISIADNSAHLPISLNMTTTATMVELPAQIPSTVTPMTSSPPWSYSLYPQCQNAWSLHANASSYLRNSLACSKAWPSTWVHWWHNW